MGLNIALVCDFFHPKIGGVESHIYFLAQTLIQRGHHVVIITHGHAPSRYGIRYLTLGLKVYYIPLRPIPPAHLHATLPNFFLAFPLLRQIFIREEIQLVHSHVALSALGLEAILHARTMGLKAVFTDHSLLGLGGFGEVWGNKMLRACLADIDGVICVSKAGRANTCIRANLDPRTVHVIPSAVVASEFQPSPSSTLDNSMIRIVCMSRLVYRKGIDLLIGAIPLVCAQYPNVTFIIGGDGPKMIELEQMCEKHQVLLKDRVEILGPVRHELVKDVLQQGQIFLNTALTEAFGIGILEAACCGLYVVSTNVGGVPEVLPSDMIELAEPNIFDVVRCIGAAVEKIKNGDHDPQKAHDKVASMYTWESVTRQVEDVYSQAMIKPKLDYVDRFHLYLQCGHVFGWIMCMVIVFDYIIFKLLSIGWPAGGIDPAVKFDRPSYERMLSRQYKKDT